MMQDFHEYLKDKHCKVVRGDFEDFSNFFEDVMDDSQSLRPVVVQLAWEIYQLQVCMEGIIEDQVGGCSDD